MIGFAHGGPGLDAPGKREASFTVQVAGHSAETGRDAFRQCLVNCAGATIPPKDWSFMSRYEWGQTHAGIERIRAEISADRERVTTHPISGA